MDTKQKSWDRASFEAHLFGELVIKPGPSAGELHVLHIVL